MGRQRAQRTNPPTARTATTSRPGKPGFRPLLNVTATTTTNRGGARRRIHRRAVSCCARARRSVARDGLPAGSVLIWRTLRRAGPNDTNSRVHGLV